MSGEARSLRTYSSAEESGRFGEATDIDDADFLARLKAAIDAEPQAVEELVREFQPNLTAYARKRQLPDPDGVVNQTLSDGLRNLPSFRGQDRRAFRAYLYQILRRRIVDEHRRSARQPETLADFPHDLEARLIDESSSSFDDGIVARSTVDELLAQLTNEQREILEMRVLAGLSIKETATRTGRSETAVKAMHRRALRSLRTVVFAATVIVLAVLGVRLLMGSGGTVEVVDNSPASDGEQSVGFDPEDEVPVVQVDVPNDEQAPIEADAELPDATDEDGDSLSSARFVVVGDPVSEEAAAEAPGEEPPVPDEPVVAPVPTSPCTVQTSAAPLAGEIAFVRFDFSGPYAFLNKTSVDVLGAKSSAIFPGVAGTKEVGHGRTVPIILDNSMFSNKGKKLTVTATLANGEAETTCARSEDALPAPCKITTGDSATVGDPAQLAFRPVAPWSIIQRRHVRPLGPEATSAFADGDPKTRALRNKGPHDFVLTKNMLTTKKPVVTIQIFGPTPAEGVEQRSGRATCI